MEGNGEIGLVGGMYDIETGKELWRLELAETSGDEKQILASIRDETLFGGRLTDTGMIHARPGPEIGPLEGWVVSPGPGRRPAREGRWSGRRPWH